MCRSCSIHFTITRDWRRSRNESVDPMHDEGLRARVSKARPGHGHQLRLHPRQPRGVVDNPPACAPNAGDVPQVVQPIREVGQYGGTWRLARTGPADFHAYGRENYDPMLRWPRDPKGAIQPGLAEKWEFNPDGSALTLTLRKG